MNTANLAGMPLNIESICENNYSRRYSPHKFYEGTLKHNERDALFFLQKRVSNDKELDEFVTIMIEMSLANARQKMSKNKTRMETEQFETKLKSDEPVREYGVPQNLIEKSDLVNVQAIYQKFTEDAVIFVPGYVMGVSVNEYGRMVSQIETIPLNEHSEVERKIRERNLNGPLNFWG